MCIRDRVKTGKCHGREITLETVTCVEITDKHLSEEPTRGCPSIVVPQLHFRNATQTVW